MNTIDEIGFLSPEISEWIIKHREKNRVIFQLAERLNRFAQKLLFEIQAHENVLQELLISILFIRSLSTFQSIIILTERGLFYEARVQLRYLMEIMFSLVAIKNDKKTAEEYVLNDKCERLRLIKKLKKSKSSQEKITGALSLLGDENKLINEINNEKIINLTTKELAKRAGLLDHYTIVYSVLCQTAHLKIKDLEGNIDLVSNKFIWGPNVIGIDYVLLTATGDLIIIAKNVIDFFNLKNKEREIENYDEKTIKLLKGLRNN